MKPSVGRVVHYVSYGTPGGEFVKQCRAAVITEVADQAHGDPMVSLCVLNPAGQFFNQYVPHDPGRHYSEIAPAGTEPSRSLCGHRWYQGGSWHWPEEG